MDKQSTVVLLNSATSRRSFLQYLYYGGAVAGASAISGCGGSSPIRDTGAGVSVGTPNDLQAVPRDTDATLDIPRGPLAGIPAVEDVGFDNIQLPPGFTIRRIAVQGSNPLNDSSGYIWHSAPDGGAVYLNQNDGGWVYVSNSEAGSGGGGVGALRFDSSGQIIDAYPILQGTSRNCAGGETPWGTWLSCEENGADGFIYECEPFGTPADAEIKPALGGRNHEACAVDPHNHVLYITEDAGSGRFWRFVSSESDVYFDAEANTMRQRFESGGLQVMNIEGFENGGVPAVGDVRESRKVTWATPGDVPGTGTAGVGGIGGVAADQYGTAFNGGEGIWYYEVPEELSTIPLKGQQPLRGVVFFTTKGDNRVWAYDIENELVELIFDNDQISVPYDDVDNLVVSPAGDVVVAEDGSGMRLMVVVPNEPAKVLFQITGNPSSEITGPAFHPDGSKLYFSAQRGPDGGNGVTYELTIPEEYR